MLVLYVVLAGLGVWTLGGSLWFLFRLAAPEHRTFKLLLQPKLLLTIVVAGFLWPVHHLEEARYDELEDKVG